MLKSFARFVLWALLVFIVCLIGLKGLEGITMFPQALSSPYSIALYKPQVFTASGVTGTAIPLNGLQSGSSLVGSSFSSATINATGTALVTATFAVQGSPDNGATFYPLLITQQNLAGASPTLSVTVTANTIYQVSVAGMTHIRFVTSGTFTAATLTLTLNASPNAQAVNGRSGGTVAGVTTFNGRNGPVTLMGSDVAGVGTLTNDTSGNAATATHATSADTATSATTAGSATTAAQATNTTQVNGAAPVANAAIAATNASGQIVAAANSAVVNAIAGTTLTNNTTGNAATATTASTATALATAPTICPGSQVPQGVDAMGNARNCATVSGGGASAGTPVQKGNGSGGFSNATMADLNLYTPGMGNSQGSLMQTLFAAGNSVLINGPTGATDSPCATYTGTSNYGRTYNYFVGQFFEFNCYSASSSSRNDTTTFHEFYPKLTATNGQTNYVGNYTSCYDHSLGQTFYGQWHTAQCALNWFQSSTPGIEQQNANVIWYTSPGDKMQDYTYFNSISGTSTTGADESRKMIAKQMIDLNSYKGTVSATVAPGVTIVYAPMTSNCGGNGANLGTCAGGDRPLIKLSSAVSLTVTSLTNNSPYFGWATLTTSNTLSNISPANGVITNAAPVTTNFYTGDTFTSPFTVSSGTMPSSGVGCWFQSSDNSMNWECNSFTYSAGTITIIDHRRQHNASSVFYVGDPEWLSPTADSTAIGSTVAYIAIPTAANTLIVTTQKLNNPSTTWLGSYGFNPSSGRGSATLYTQGSRAISVSDPTVAGPPDNSHRPDSPNIGFFKLEAHSFGFTAGDTVEQTLLPIDSSIAYWTLCGSKQPSNGTQRSNCHLTLVSGIVDAVYEIDLNTPSSLLTPTGYFPQYDIFQIRGGTTPYNNMLNIVQNSPTNLFFFSSNPTGTINLLNFANNNQFSWNSSTGYKMIGNFAVTGNLTLGTGPFNSGPLYMWRIGSSAYLPALQFIRPFNTTDLAITAGAYINALNGYGYATGAFEEGSAIINGSFQGARIVAGNPLPQALFASGYGTNGSATPVSTPTGSYNAAFGYSCDTALGYGIPVWFSLFNSYDPANTNPSFSVTLPLPNTGNGLGTECSSYSLWNYNPTTTGSNQTRPLLVQSGITAGGTFVWSLTGTPGAFVVPSGRSQRNINMPVTAARLDTLTNGVCVLFDIRAQVNNATPAECQSGLSYNPTGNLFSLDTTVKGNGAAGLKLSYLYDSLGGGSVSISNLVAAPTGYSNTPITTNTTIAGSPLITNYYEVNCTCTITLPTLSTLLGQRFIFINIGTGTVTISGSAIGNATTSTTDTIATGLVGSYISNAISAWRKL